MQATIIEIKARVEDLAPARTFLTESGARSVGLDHQVDTYFDVRDGRMKWRAGTIEHALIYYRRPDQEGPKRSDAELVQDPDPALRTMLEEAVGILVTVDKRREIYFLDNVKVHLDQVERLGTFIEIEAIDTDGRFPVAELERQCRKLMEKLGIAETDLVDGSYSDLLLWS
jgi:adenylate cyclase, class 2